MSGGGKTQTSKSKVQIPAWVKDQYLQATNMAGQAAATPWQAYSNDPNAFVAPLTGSQQAGMANINQYAQSAQPWYQGAGMATLGGMGPADLGQLNVDQYMSPYLRNVAQTTSDLMNQQNQQAMSGQLGNAIQSGAAWGDRSGIAAANLNQQQNLANANILSNLLNQGFTQAQGVAQQQQGADLAARQANLARLMQGGLNLGQLGSGAQASALQGGQAQMAAGQQEQQTQQAGLSALYNQWLQQRAYPFQTAQFFANIAEGIGGNAGSTNTLTQPAGFFSGLARGGRAGKASGGGLGEASMGGHVGMEHAMEGFADGGAPMDYSTMVLQGLFGGTNPNAGAYGLAGGMPGGGGFVPQPNMQPRPFNPAEAPPARQGTSAGDLMNMAEKGADLYNTEGAQNALGYAKDFLGFTSEDPILAANGGRIGLAAGGLPYEVNGGTAGYVPTSSAPGSSFKGASAPAGNKPTSGSDVLGAASNFKNTAAGAGKIFDIGQNFLSSLPSRAAGGRTGYAVGGMPYEQGPSAGLGYVPVQDDEQHKKLETAQVPTSQQQSGLGKIADIAKTAATIIPMFLKDGGVAGRHGYATDGSVGGWADWVGSMLPGSMTGIAGGDIPDWQRQKIQAARTSAAIQNLNTHPAEPAPEPAEGVPAAGGTYDATTTIPASSVSADGYDPISNAIVSGFVNPWRTGGFRAAPLPLTEAPRQPSPYPGQSVDSTIRAPERTWQDFASDSALGLQKAAADALKWTGEKAASVAADPNAPWAERGLAGLAGGLAAGPEYLGVVGGGMANKLFGHPEKGQIFWPGDPNATAQAAATPEATSLPSEPAMPTAPVSAVENQPAPPEPGLAPVTPAYISGTNAAIVPGQGLAGAAATPVAPKAAPTSAATAAPTSISPVQGYQGRTAPSDQVEAARKLNRETTTLSEGSEKNPRDPNGGTRYGFNLAQYQAVNPRIRSLDDVQEKDAYMLQDKWFEQNHGPQLANLYGPQFAAAYTNLSMVAPGTAWAALHEANGDPNKFFDIMKGKLVALGQNPKYAANMNGWVKRVEDTRKIAMSGAPAGNAPSSGGLVGGTAVASAEPSKIPSGGGIGIPSISPAGDDGVQQTGLGRAATGTGNWLKEHGTDLILPFLSGLGTMASSPSRFLGSAILQGIGGGADTYMKRQSQLANIAQTQALTQRSNIGAVRDAIYYDQGTGQTYAVLANGGLQPLADYMERPAGQIAGGASVDQTVRHMGIPGVTQFVTGNATEPTAGMPVSPAAPKPVDTSRMYWSPGMNEALAEDRRAATRSGSQALVEQSNIQFNNIQNAEMAALRNIPNTSEMANVVSAAIADGNAGPLNAWITENVTGKARNAARLLGIDPNIMSSPSDAQAVIMNKLAALNASQLTPEGQDAYSSLKMFADLSPYIGQPPEAMAAITAQLMANQQRALDLAPVVREYRNRSLNGVITNAEREFNRGTEARYAAERDQLQSILTSKDPEIRKVIEEISTGRMTSDDAAKIFDHLYGNPMLYRYFPVGGR